MLTMLFLPYLIFGSIYIYLYLISNKQKLYFLLFYNFTGYYLIVKTTVR